MPRTVWSGAISFGLVTAPISVVSATEDRIIPFHRYHLQDMGRVRVRKVCALEDREVSQDATGKGYKPTKTWSDSERLGLPQVREGVPVLREEFRDQHTEALARITEAPALIIEAGPEHEVLPEAPEPEQLGQVLDLVGALNASAGQAEVSPGGSAEVHALPKPKKKAAAEKQPAKEVTAKKAPGRRPCSA